jgi:hypothetical protein
MHLRKKLKVASFGGGFYTISCHAIMDNAICKLCGHEIEDLFHALVKS